MHVHTYMYCQIIKQYTPATPLQYLASTLNIVQYRNQYSISGMNRRINMQYMYIHTEAAGWTVSVVHIPATACSMALAASVGVHMQT